LVTPGLLDDLGGNGATTDQRRTNLEAGSVVHHEDFAECDHVALGGVTELLDANDIVLGDLVLLAACFDDCVHLVLPLSGPACLGEGVVPTMTPTRTVNSRISLESIT